MSLATAANQLQKKVSGVLAVALPLSLIVFAYEREIVPLYGFVSTMLYLDKVMLAAMLLSALQPFPINTSLNYLLTAVALTAAPNATYWIAVWTARQKDPLWGPVITHAAALGPLAFLLSSFVIESEDTDSQAGTATRPPPTLRVIRALMTFLITFPIFQNIWFPSSFLNDISGSQIFLALAGVSFSAWILSLQLDGSSVTKEAPATSKKKKVTRKSPSSFSGLQIKAAILAAFGPLWFSMYNIFANPVLQHPIPERYTHPSFPLQILMSEQSVTGLITVAEWLPPPNYKPGENEEAMHSARYLRASHSLLGGVWVRDKVQTLDDEPPLQDVYGAPLGDSIYSTFIVQEAVRLVNSTDVGSKDKLKNALIIGLGTGISANALMNNGISTTIVEIDPAVYNAARTWFGLQDPGKNNLFIEDARTWVEDRHNRVHNGQKEMQYDVVIHDCFSGGGVPQHIFTVEFWDQLKTVMAPEAVLAVNFAGILQSESSRLVINTLEKSFGQCRAFHDAFEAVPEDKYTDEFINMVFFCTQSQKPLTFRNSKRSDWLGSPLRRHILQSMDSREVNLDLIRTSPEERDKHILTDQHNPLGELQRKQGGHHWQVMREVLSDTHWETY
ncbi:hypothetical protein CPB83DRAFT_842919 [Crepidotus variabilis]|uniref:PABS domain-containing protein n=1 Tax=Crepidotus variabilis TaxID=179855 RepID=A0A9P6ETB0_9AGAR|nr:hypothetical protein CPB83DRAFT_842919 [Crepidotus variabilis]